MMEPYTLDRNFDKIDVVDHFESFIWTERYYGDSDTQITVPATPEMMDKLPMGIFLGISESDEIMILENREFDNGMMTLSGPALLPWMNNRFIRSSPNHEDRYWAAPEGVPGWVLWQILYNFCVEGSPYLDGTNPIGVIDPEKLAIPGLGLKSYDTAGDNITVGIPFGPVYDAMKEIATTYEVGMQIVFDTRLYEERMYWAYGFTKTGSSGLFSTKLYRDEDPTEFASEAYMIANPTDHNWTYHGQIGYAISAIDMHPQTKVLYATTTSYDVNAPDSLIQIDKVTGEGTVIGDLYETVDDICFLPDGRLFAIYQCDWDPPLSDSELHSGIIDLDTGDCDEIGGWTASADNMAWNGESGYYDGPPNSNLPDVAGGVACFYNRRDHLVYVFHNGLTFRVDPNEGEEVEPFTDNTQPFNSSEPDAEMLPWWPGPSEAYPLAAAADSKGNPYIITAMDTAGSSVHLQKMLTLTRDVEETHEIVESTPHTYPIISIHIGVGMYDGYIILEGDLSSELPQDTQITITGSTDSYNNVSRWVKSSSYDWNTNRTTVVFHYSFHSNEAEGDCSAILWVGGTIGVSGNHLSRYEFLKDAHKGFAIVNSTDNDSGYYYYWVESVSYDAEDDITRVEIVRDGTNGGQYYPLGPLMSDIGDGEVRSVGELSAEFVDEIGAMCDAICFGDAELAHNLGFRSYRGVDRTGGQTENAIVQFSRQLDTFTGIKELQSIANLKTLVYTFAPGNPDELAVAPGISFIDEPGLTGFDLRALQVFAEDITTDMVNGDPTKLVEILNSRARDALTNNAYIVTVDGEVVPNGQFQYGRDYHLGDLVETRGYTQVKKIARVTEFIRSQDATGVKAYPTLTTIGSENDVMAPPLPAILWIAG